MITANKPRFHRHSVYSAVLIAPITLNILCFVPMHSRDQRKNHNRFEHQWYVIGTSNSLSSTGDPREETRITCTAVWVCNSQCYSSFDSLLRAFVALMFPQALFWHSSFWQGSLSATVANLPRRSQKRRRSSHPLHIPQQMNRFQNQAHTSTRFPGLKCTKSQPHFP